MPTADNKEAISMQKPSQTVFALHSSIIFDISTDIGLVT